MTGALRIAAALSLCIAIPAVAATIHDEDFESIPIGSLDGQTGSGGISWAKTALGGSADAFAALPGHTGEQSGRWDVKDTGSISEGDDMVGAFAAVGPQIVVTAWTYSFLSVDPLYSGKRAGTFQVFDDMFNAVGVGLVWRADGLLGSTLGDVSNISFVNQVWKQIRIELDYATEAWALYYDSQLVASGNSLPGSAAGASVLNIVLETKNLSDNPNPNDSFLVDDIEITPEPASAAVLGLLALLRRR
jgi:hypothetical protein